MNFLEAMAGIQRTGGHAARAAWPATHYVTCSAEVPVLVSRDTASQTIRKQDYCPSFVDLHAVDWFVKRAADQPRLGFTALVQVLALLPARYRGFRDGWGPGHAGLAVRSDVVAVQLDVASILETDWYVWDPDTKLSPTDAEWRAARRTLDPTSPTVDVVDVLLAKST